MSETFESVYGEITRRTDTREAYHDRWDRAVTSNVVLAVYVPVPGSAVVASILPRSGIVGSSVTEASTEEPGTIAIDFEGNKFGAANMETWDDKVHHAAGRHVSVYPTVARMQISEREVHQVGTYSVRTRRVTVTDSAALERWLTEGD